MVGGILGLQPSTGWYNEKLDHIGNKFFPLQWGFFFMYQSTSAWSYSQTPFCHRLSVAVCNTCTLRFSHIPKFFFSKLSCVIY